MLKGSGYQFNVVSCTPVPGFPSHTKQVDHILDHTTLWFRVTGQEYGPEYGQPGTINLYDPENGQPGAIKRKIG